MTVNAQFRVDRRPYSGFTARALPTGAYIAQGGVVGDASGGSVLMDFLYADDERPRSSELFNIEQYSVDVTPISTLSQCLMRTLSMDMLAPTRVASSQKWTIQLQSDGVEDRASDFRGLSGLPIWIGAPDSSMDLHGIRFEWDNIDLVFYAATLQGYVWGPRSILAEGGPQRPVGSLFR